MSRLSKSKHPAYHLRPNKAVDRLIFVEILRAFELLYPLDNHVYIGFGGPFLEDFRLLAQVFPKLELISIENDEETLKRQLSHLCSSRMTALHSTFEQFLATNLPSDQPVVVWADYTDMKRECLVEAADIARRVTPGSVYKITVRAESPVPGILNLGRRRLKKIPKNKRTAFEKFCSDYRDRMAVDDISFGHSWFTWEGFSDSGFPELLFKMIRAVVEGSCSHPKTFIPLHACKYSDGTIMLSLTGMFCLDDEREKIVNHFKSNCPVSCVSDCRVEEIDVPVLTTKERLSLDRILPTSCCDGKVCVEKLGYLIDGDDSEAASVRKMGQYEKFYRLYPYFGRLVP